MRMNPSVLAPFATLVIASGMLTGPASISRAQEEMQLRQVQPDSVVAIVADSQGFPLLPLDQVPFFGTYWTVVSYSP